MSVLKFAKITGVGKIKRFYEVLQSFTKFYKVLRSFTKFYKVLQSFTKFYQSVPPKILNCDKTGFFSAKTSLIGDKTIFPLSNARS